MSEQTDRVITIDDLADGQVQEEPFFITEEIEAEMIAAGYVFEPPAHFTTTNARRLFDLRARGSVLAHAGSVLTFQYFRSDPKCVGM